MVQWRQMPILSSQTFVIRLCWEHPQFHSFEIHHLLTMCSYTLCQKIRAIPPFIYTVCSIPNSQPQHTQYCQPLVITILVLIFTDRWEHVVSLLLGLTYSSKHSILLLIQVSMLFSMTECHSVLRGYGIPWCIHRVLLSPTHLLLNTYQTPNLHSCECAVKKYIYIWEQTF